MLNLIGDYTALRKTDREIGHKFVNLRMFRCNIDQD
jgi:hypothetical protein